MNIKKLAVFFVLLMSFTQIFAEDYYWVGGRGDWSDLNSWRTINGSIPNEVPDVEDNVIFNQNSFLQDYDTVFIYTGNPSCKNLTFINIQDTVVIVGGNPNSTLTVYGSFTLHGKVIWDYMGKTFFQSDLQGNTITCAGRRFPGDIWFEGSGEWILQDTLFVYDSTDWKAIIYGGTDPLAQDPFIVHRNGTFNANGQTIITRGFQTIGNSPRSCLIPNSDVLMVGNWILGAENLNFVANDSYILIGGNMNNSTGDLISYHDIDFLPVDGSIKNTDIKTFMRKVHFLGGGSLDGKKTPGTEGSFIIDTLLMEGAFTMAGPVPNEIGGVFNNIHYTQINLTMGYIETNKSEYHRIDFNCGIPSYLKGYENEIDSIHFFTPEGALAGDNIVNNLLLFNAVGVLSSWVGKDSYVEHAVFMDDGHMLGNNSVNLLTLNSGIWMQLGCDSLSQPGSYYTNNIIQTIHQIETGSDCLQGLTMITTNSKETQAIINYTGSPVAVEFLMVRDINNIGNTVNISKGIDLGNNIGFTFTNPHLGRTLYWVGGDGVWDDITHWSLTSGGYPGDQCPPTIYDDIFFDNLSGFDDIGMEVNVNVKHAMFNDMTWTDLTNQPTFSGSTFLHIWGSVKLDPSMSYLFFGDVYFESEDDDEYESIDLTYRLETDPGVYEIYQWLFGKVYFYGRGGKWRFDSKYVDYYDTTILKMGKILLENDTMICFNFNSDDTLRKGIYFLGNTLCEVHAYQQDAWLLNAYGAAYAEDPMVDYDTSFVFNFGNSIIRSYGDISPPMGAPPGFGNIRTYAGEVKYHNIEFSDSITSGIRSILISESKCEYNLVDYYIQFGDGVGNGVIDTLTYKKWSTAGADGCKLRNNYHVNFVNG